MKLNLFSNVHTKETGFISPLIFVMLLILDKTKISKRKTRN